MDNRNDWKRANNSAPSRSGNGHSRIRDGKDGQQRQYGNSANRRDDNYGNRVDDYNSYDYNRRDNEYDSGYIDLSSAVDSIPGKKKRKRIVKEAPEKPYQKVVLKGKKPIRQIRQQPIKKSKPLAPVYPEVVIDKPIRLNRYISNTGLCSRREADERIKAGDIQVNGEVVTEMGVKVNPGDEVCYKGSILSSQRKIYLLLNKPKGFVTSLDEPKGKKLVIDLVRSACKERIYPVGRLDKMTTGILLFTNDGDLSLKLTHPSNRMRKVYQVSLDKPIEQADLDKLAAGIELEDGFIAFDAIALTDPENPTQVGVEIHSGKNRIVRRMFESVGYKVLKLDRVYFAGLTKKGLKRGKWRFLSPEEVAFLKMMPA